MKEFVLILEQGSNSMHSAVKNSIRLAVICLGLFSFILPSHAQEKAQLVIAVVDMGHILATASAPKSIAEQMNAKRKIYQTEMQQEENKLRDGQQELARQRAILSPEAFKKERAKFEQKFVAAQKKIQTRKNSLEKARVAAMDKVSASLKKVITKIVEDNKITLLLRKELTVFTHQRLNITPVVIKELNAILPAVEVFPKVKGAK
ncbi:MAG: OmpH family outer membrane protein [Rhodospirillales bacterium]|nr:OmpH family outer membrane protein [Rhodospirillales bacterium]